MESSPLDVAPESAGPNPIDALRAACIPYVPTASATHFFMWLVFAAPARFFCLESASQVVVASRSHFVMKLLRAAPASFLSAASDLQVANAAADEIRQTASAKAIFFIAFLHRQLCGPRGRAILGEAAVAEKPLRRVGCSRE